MFNKYHNLQNIKRLVNASNIHKRTSYQSPLFLSLIIISFIISAAKCIIPSVRSLYTRFRKIRREIGNTIIEKKMLYWLFPKK